MKDRQVIIFDFDGTLADVVPIFKKIYKQLGPKYGMRTVSDEDYLFLRQKPVWRVMLWTRLMPWHLRGLLHDGRRLFAQEKQKVNLFDGVPELVKKLHKNHFQLYVLSSNHERTIRAILDRYNLNDEFIVMKRPEFFGKAKSIKKLINQQHYSKSNVWMVGDETRDSRAGIRAGVNTISVTWGLQAREVLQTVNPDHLVDSVNELEKIFSN